MRPIAEQTILVIGSTGGLARRVTEEIVKQGATVLVHGRDPDKVESGTHGQADDRDARRWLWEESERLTGLS